MKFLLFLVLIFFSLEIAAQFQSSGNILTPKNTSFDLSSSNYFSAFEEHSFILENQEFLGKKAISIIPQIGLSTRRAKLVWNDISHEEANFKSLTDMSFGFLIEARIGNFDDKWAIFGTIDFVPQYTATTTFILNQNSSQKNEDEATFDYKAINLTIGLKHYLNLTENLRVFPSLSFGIKKIGNKSFYDSKKLTGSFLQNDLQLTAGFGIELLKKISLDFNFSLVDKVDTLSGANATPYLNQTSLKLGYRFWLF